MCHQSSAKRAGTFTAINDSRISTEGKALFRMNSHGMGRSRPSIPCFPFPKWDPTAFRFGKRPENNNYQLEHILYRYNGRSCNSRIRISLKCANPCAASPRSGNHARIPCILPSQQEKNKIVSSAYPLSSAAIPCHAVARSLGARSHWSPGTCSFQPTTLLLGLPPTRRLFFRLVRYERISCSSKSERTFP